MSATTEALRSASEGLAANKLRSILTTLGVAIGVGAVILLVAIGSGLQSDVSRQIMGLGSNLVLVVPGKVDLSSGPGGGAQTAVNKLVLEDGDYVRRRSTLASAVVPIFQGQATVKFGNRGHFTQVLGTTPEYVPVRNFPTAKGRFFRDAELSGNRKVVALGKVVADKLFPNRNPVGERITINGQRFTVIAVMSVKGGGLGINLDDQVFVPITTAQAMFGAKNVSLFFVEVSDPDKVSAAKNEVTRIMSRRQSTDDFSVLAQEEILGTFLGIAGTLTLALAGIAGISLLVGGTGIMNIMLVSVTERTREIGIRKAVGARTYHILLQFVAEAVVLSLLGGTIGIAIGWAGAAALDAVLPTMVTGWSIVVAFLFSAGVGVFFGVYPAYKASRLKPIEALRYE